MSNPPPPPYDPNARQAPPPPPESNASPTASTSQIAPPAPQPGTSSQRIVVQQIVQPQPPQTNTEEEPLKPKVIYVDQHGNPITPVTQQQSQKVIVRHVPQTQTEPVRGPSDAGEAEPLNPKVVYVDSSGRPVQSAPSNIQYVHSATTPITSTHPTSQTNIQYVDEHGRPVPPPQPQQLSQPTQPTKDTEADQREKRIKIIVFIIGCIACLILFIGLCLDNLTYYEAAAGLTGICGYTAFKIDCDDAVYESYWYDCDDAEDLAFSWADYCTADNERICDTQIAAILALVMLIIAFVVCIMAVILVQPWKVMTRCCFEENQWVWTSKIYFLISAVFCLLCIIFWVAIDEYCHEETQDTKLGGTILCAIIGMVFNVIAAAIMFIAGIF